jgi:putative transposase
VPNCLPTAELYRKFGLSPATFFKMKAKYGGMDLSDAKRLKQLEEENIKLKHLVADVMLDNVVLKDLLRKAPTTPANRRDAVLQSMPDGARKRQWS